MNRAAVVGRTALCWLACVRGVAAQSTESLGRYARDVQYQVSAATRSPFVGSAYGAQTGALGAAEISAQFLSAGAMTLRLDGWLIERTGDGGQSNGQHRSYLGHLLQSRTVAALVAGEFPIRLPGEIVVGPIIGAGVVPYARGVFDMSGTGGPTSDARTGVGWVTSVGVVVRWRHLVVEQHVLQILGADGALGNGETAPIAIGWRF